MRFSTVTPNLNGMPYLPRCAGSICQQTRTAYEHIVKDGGSTDGSLNWLKSHANIVLKDGPDSGMYDAINSGFAEAKGDVLSWLNHDEQYLPRTLEIVESIFEQHESADIVFGDCIAITPEGEAVSARREIPLRRWYAINGTLYVSSCTMFIRRRAWERAGPFDTSYRICGDKEWIMRAWDAGCRFHHVPEFLALFTLTRQNLSQHDAAPRESARIRQTFGAHQSQLPRLLARGCRQIEKLLRGCQGKRRVEYRFMTDDVHSQMLSATVGSRWQWRL